MDLNTLFGYEGKTVVVSGAYSGMGRAAAKLLSELGAEVYTICRRNGRHSELDFPVAGEFHADFGVKEDLDQLAEELPEHIDALFLCHGIALNSDGSNTMDVQKVNFLGHKYLLEKVIDRYMDAHPEINTFISPYCPAVTRLVQMRFPSLVDNVIHVRAPLELASRVITKRLMDEGIPRKDIGVFYVTPCAAKIAAVKYPVSGKETFVTGVINMDFLYNKVLLMLHDSDKNAQPINHALTTRDVLWPLSGGEAPHFKGAHYAVDGLRNVLDFLEKLEDEAVDAPGLVEMRICDQGCVGGVLATNNRFVARKRLEYRGKLFERLERSKLREAVRDDYSLTDQMIEDMTIPEIKPRSILKLNDDFREAFKMAERMKKIENALPGVNCSACGAPSCAALAEDIVRGDAGIDTCIFINRHSKASEDAIRSIWGNRIKTKENYKNEP